MAFGPPPLTADTAPMTRAGRNIHLTVEFDGTGYSGWQFQPSQPSVQAALETALAGVTGAATKVYGCGRTDAGVSARNYVANFHTASRLPTERLRLALNASLPDDILVKSARDEAPDFHARHSARSKTYRYLIVAGRSPLRRRHAWEFRFRLDPGRMKAAAVLFEGRRDFSAFCQTRNRSGVCRVSRVAVAARTDEVVIAVKGDRFLYKMVRRIVGALVACGAGRLTERDIRAALAGRPAPVFPTAPARGLVLDRVTY
jgi:tRNA pseudouridine38-40 synthase